MYRHEEHDGEVDNSRAFDTLYEVIERGEPIIIGEEWIDDFSSDERTTVAKLTDYLAEALLAVTLNAPDWSTLRFIQAARRLYKPATARLAPRSEACTKRGPN